MLMQRSFAAMSLGAEDEGTMSIATKNLDTMVGKIPSYKSSVVITNAASDDDDNEAFLWGMSVLDSFLRKGKGTSYGRLESSSEKKILERNNRNVDR